MGITEKSYEKNINQAIFRFSMTTESKQIMNELKSIKEELHFIKEHMVDVDTILTVGEKKLLDESIKNEKTGKLTSLEKLENVRNSA
jgi:hypothetical protein